MDLKRARRVAMAALSISAIAAAANAQGIDPSSRQNVVPRVSTAAVGTLEAQRQALFARMLRNPSDLDTAFEYAAVVLKLGDIEGAISTLERMLIFAPGLPRLQFELGVLYFRLGAYDTASTYLTTVAQAGDVPADVRAQVDEYLAAIERRSSGSSFSGVVTTGVRYQTNANAGPDSPVINLNGFNFLLNPGATSQPDANGFAAANLHAAIDLENQGDRLDVSLLAYGSLYRNQTQLDTGILELQIGPTFNLQRYKIDNASLGVYGILGTAFVAGQPYLGTVGVGADIRIALDARTHVVLRLEGRQEEFMNSALRPNAALRSGQRYLASAMLEYQLTPDLSVNATLTAGRRNATAGYLSSWATGASLGATLDFASPVAALTDPWSIGVSAGVLRELADAPDPVFSTVAAEDTTQVFVQGTLTVPLSQGFAVQANGIYNVSVSNYGFGNYTNLGASLGVSRRF